MRTSDAIERAEQNRLGGGCAVRFVLAAGLALFPLPGGWCLAAGVDRPASQLVATCAACHRLDNKPNGIPPILGLGATQVVNMMSGFKARTQSSPIMHVVGQSLSATEIVAIADYLGALETAKNP